MNIKHLIHGLFPPSSVQPCLDALSDLSRTRHSWANLSLDADGLFQQICPEIKALYLDPNNLDGIKKSLDQSSPREVVLYTFCMRLEQIVSNGETGAYNSTFSRGIRGGLQSLHSALVSELIKLGFCSSEEGRERCLEFESAMGQDKKANIFDFS